MDDKISWFTQMEVLYLIYHQYFFTTNSLGQQPTTSQFFQPLTPQTLALVAAAIRCALSEYATGKNVTVMFSQDEYWGKFCTSTVIDCITAEATALINYTWWASSYPPPPMVLLCYNRRSWSHVGTPQSGLALHYLIQHSFSPSLLALLLQDGRSSIPSSILIRSATISLQTLYLPPLLELLSMDGLLRLRGTPESLSALHSLAWWFCISFTAPHRLLCRWSSSRMGAPQSPTQLRLGVPLSHSRLIISLPLWGCSAWMGCSAR